MPAEAAWPARCGAAGSSGPCRAAACPAGWRTKRPAPGGGSEHQARRLSDRATRRLSVQATSGGTAWLAEGEWAAPQQAGLGCQGKGTESLRSSGNPTSRSRSRVSSAWREAITPCGPRGTAPRRMEPRPQLAASSGPHAACATCRGQRRVPSPTALSGCASGAPFLLPNPHPAPTETHHTQPHRHPPTHPPPRPASAHRLEERKAAHELLAQHAGQLLVQPLGVQLAGAHDGEPPSTGAGGAPQPPGATGAAGGVRRLAGLPSPRLLAGRQERLRAEARPRSERAPRQRLQLGHGACPVGLPLLRWGRAGPRLGRLPVHDSCDDRAAGGSRGGSGMSGHGVGCQTRIACRSLLLLRIFRFASSSTV